MTRKTLLMLAFMLLAACHTAGPNFRAMSQVELDAHNAGLSEWDQIVCVKEVRAGSHFKNTYCMSRRDLQLRDLGVVSRINSALTGNRVSIDAY